MKLLRVVWRGGQIAAHIAFGAALAALRPEGIDARIALWWCCAACRILHLRVRVQGELAPSPVLYAANHVSWLEVIALGSLTPMGFVAKDDVARWPVIGRLAAAGGTLFLRRGSSRAAARAAEALAARLSAGRSVVIFPEGTSTDGRSVLAFRAALFEAAVSVSCSVQPVAVSYPSVPGGHDVAPFIGDDAFAPHLLRVLAEPEIVVDLHFVSAISGRGRGRAELAHSSRETIVSRLAALGHVASSSAERLAL